MEVEIQPHELGDCTQCDNCGVTNGESNAVAHIVIQFDQSKATLGPLVQMHLCAFCAGRLSASFPRELHKYFLNLPN